MRSVSVESVIDVALYKYESAKSRSGNSSTSTVEYLESVDVPKFRAFVFHRYKTFVRLLNKLVRIGSLFDDRNRCSYLYFRQLGVSLYVFETRTARPRYPYSAMQPI